MNEPADLRPCPWCGQAPRLERHRTGWASLVHEGCIFLPDFTVDFLSEKEAVWRWNQRYVGARSIPTRYKIAPRPAAPTIEADG
jgi:hypothetical protein